MAKFDFIAVPLLQLDRRPNGIVGRQLEIMSAKTIRRQFEAYKVEEAVRRFSDICDELAKDGQSWHAWADTARRERAPNGFRAAKNQFLRDINPEAVTISEAA
jgi:hypothetical protein